VIVLRLLQFLEDLLNGFWSGFPACCVWYYARHNDGHLAESPWEQRGGWEQDWERGVRYVQCPRCRAQGSFIPEASIRAGELVLVGPLWGREQSVVKLRPAKRQPSRNPATNRNL
jgi:hypothetical protein